MCFDHKFSDRSGPSNPLSNAVSPPAPNALHGQSPSSGNSSTLLFVIGGMTVLIILLILVLYFWKFNKPEKLKKFLKKKRSMTETKDFWSGNLQTINYFDFQTLKKATKNFHPANLLSEVAFLCLQPLANLRSPMSRIVAQLTCKVEMVGTPMRPVFLQRSRRKDDNLSWDTNI
ncbi:hypothetical protein NC652_015952 [Populus alba x Populus x berolinensis]|nr:hypothetical protein NC652_015952 [Populus alba x Populus x berolinensis]